MSDDYATCKFDEYYITYLTDDVLKPLSGFMGRALARTIVEEIRLGVNEDPTALEARFLAFYEKYKKALIPDFMFPDFSCMADRWTRHLMMTQDFEKMRRQPDTPDASEEVEAPFCRTTDCPVCSPQPARRASKKPNRFKPY